MGIHRAERQSLLANGALVNVSHLKISHYQSTAKVMGRQPLTNFLQYQSWRSNFVVFDEDIVKMLERK